MIRVDRSIYMKTVTEYGVPVEPPEQMGEQFVRTWLDSSAFFDALTSTPEVHEKLPGGVIRVTQTTPWDTKRITTFTPTS